MPSGERLSMRSQPPWLYPFLYSSSPQPPRGGSDFFLLSSVQPRWSMVLRLGHRGQGIRRSLSPSPLCFTSPSGSRIPSPPPPRSTDGCWPVVVPIRARTYSSPFSVTSGPFAGAPCLTSLTLALFFFCCVFCLTRLCTPSSAFLPRSLGQALV